MLADVAESRIVAATAATLSFTGQDSDGEPSDPGTVTVGVVDSSGSAVVATGTATAASGNDRTIGLTAANTASVDRLTATWSAGGVVLAVTQHDVVGGVYATTARIRADGDGLLVEEKYSKAALILARTKVEYQFERSCRRAFVPRFQSEIVDSVGAECLVLSKPDLREVVWAQRFDGSAWVDAGVTLTGIEPSDAGLAVLASGCWPSGRVRVGYRHGFDRCPPDLRDAAIEAISFLLHSDKSGIDPRVTDLFPAEGGRMQLATPGLGIWVTAIPTVDSVLKDYRWSRIGVG